MKFSKDAAESAYAPREIIGGKDAKTLAKDLLAMSRDDFSTSFRKSPMKRAKLAGLQRNARFVLEHADEV